MNRRFLIFLSVLTAGGLTVTAAQTPAQPGLRDIRGPVQYPLDPAVVVLLAVIILAGAVVLLRWLWRLYQRRRAFVPPVPPRPPWDIALEQLDALREKKYLEYAKFDQYYSELSDILRRYMEDYFGVRAPEMTTEEFLETIRHNATVSADHKEILTSFMRQADLVKFAKGAPALQEAEQSWELARRFIMQSYDDEDEAK